MRGENILIMKKFLAIILSFTMIFSNVSADVSQDTTFDVNSISDPIYNALLYYDLYDALSNYSIGNNIEIYDVSVSNALNIRENYLFYPVYKDNQVVLTVYIYNNTAKISTIGVEQLNSIGTNNKVVIVSNESSAFLVSDSKAELIETDVEVDYLDQEVINLAEELMIQTSNESMEEHELTFSPQVQQLSLNSQSILNFPIVAQNPYPNGCWAACIAAFCNYYKGPSYTATNVVQTCIGNISASSVPGKSIYQIKNYLSNIYSITTVVESQSTAIANFKSRLNNGKAYIVGWAPASSTSGHVTVLYGYSENSNNTSNFYIMDPQKYSSVTSGATTYILSQLGSTTFPTNSKIFGGGTTYYFVNSISYSSIY